MSGEPAGAIVLEEQGALLSDASAEVARIWVTDGAGSAVWINAGVIEDPHVFGYLMADTIRHAARAYAREQDMPEDEALQQIVNGLTEDLRAQASPTTTLHDGSLN